MTVTGLYLVLNITCISILTVVLVSTLRSIRLKTEKQLFIWTLASNMLMFVMDAVWALIDSRQIAASVSVNEWINVLYFVAGAVAGYSWLLYTHYRLHPNRIQTLWIRLLMAIPLLLLLAGSLASIRTGWLFYVDAANAYHRGPYYFM